MIRDLSETLRALLDDPALAPEFPELAAAAVAFDRPAETFSPGQSTIDLFLYDVREDMELRSNEPLRTRTNGDVHTRPAPLRVLCSYLVTAWPVGGTELPLQEHRLLSQALQVLSRTKQIPSALLRGKLIGQQPPLPMMTAQSDGLKEPHEFWTAIGNKLRPSLVVTVTIGMDLFPAVTAPAVISSEIHLGPRAATDGPGLATSAGPPRFRIGGRITDAAHAPVVDANVGLVELDLMSRTDEEGHYQLGAMTAGTYTVRVTKGAVLKNASVTVPPGAGTTYDVQL
jgi:hypothetical protein